MIMKKRILAIVVAGILILSLPLAFSGCGKQEAASSSSGASVAKTGEKITVILPKHEMDTVGFHEEMTRKFEQETGIEVELINESWENVADSVMTDLTAGGGAYDVIEFDNAWVQKFYDNDWLTPLNDYASDEIMKGMLPGLIDKFSVDGKLYGIAWNNDTRFFMYNSQMLKDAGYDGSPETWSELTEMSKAIQTKGVAPYGFIDSYMNQQTGSNEITFLVYSFGGKLFDDQGNPVMANDAKTKAAFEFIVNAMNTDKIVDPGSLTADYETVANVFCTGGSAFMLQAWPGVYSLANDPESSSIVDQIAVANTAVHADGEQQMVLTLPEAMAIPKTSQHKDAAWKYIEYMSSKEFDKQRAETIGALPIWTDLFSDSDLLAKYPYWKNFAGQIASSQGLPNLTWYDEYTNVLMTEVQKMMLGQTTVDDGLKSIQDQCIALQKENS
jgi:multiple sugar transport system substrate-binding protein